MSCYWATKLRSPQKLNLITLTYIYFQGTWLSASIWKMKLVVLEPNVSGGVTPGENETVSPSGSLPLSLFLYPYVHSLAELELNKWTSVCFFLKTLDCPQQLGLIKVAVARKEDCFAPCRMWQPQISKNYVTLNFGGFGTFWGFGFWSSK